MADQPITSLLVKLASLAVHVEEALSDTSHPFDWEVTWAILRDPEVRAFLDDIRNAPLLPLKRWPKQDKP